MQKLQSTRRSWIWLLVLLVLFSIISFFITTQKPKIYPNYVSDSPSPTGVKAFYTYMKDEINGKRWTHSPGLLPKNNDHQLLVMVEPAFVPNEKETKAYLDFIEAGNTILLLKLNPKGMFDLNTEPFEESPATSMDSKQVLDKNGIEYKAEIQSFVRLVPKEKDQILLKDNAGPVALKRDYGKGQLMVAVAPEWITNSNLLKNDHLPLIVTLLNERKPKTILFDEYIHTPEGAFTRLMVYPKWFLLLILQGILLSCIWLWYQGKRFGPVFIPREETVRFSDEGIRALTAWFIRGKRYQDSIIIQADYVKQLLQEYWHIPYNSDWKDLDDRLERKWKRKSKSEIQSFLKGLAAVLNKEKISKQEYMLWSKKIDGLRKEVEEG